jgi:two-component system, chemotaxis family, CheB/CheR fusion protein
MISPRAVRRKEKMNDRPAPGDQALIVVGASAGGIDALERLASALPADFPAPVVVAQHLDPSHESLLHTILRQRSALRVELLSEDVALVPGTLYVVPAGKHVEIVDGGVSLRGTTKSGPTPSIDILFSSAARAYADRAIGVILSGTGADGPSGVLAIKEAGGTIVIQDPLTAAYPSLPASIPPNLVDMTVNIESLGSLLTTMVTDGDGTARTVDPEMLHGFLLQLRTRSGIDFTQYKSPTIRRRMARLMAASRCKTLPDYMRYLSANPEAYQRLVSSFLIKVTGFFRDPALFKSLREEILPELIEYARKNKTELRLWSAGCATGEEAYSLAILLAEVLGDQLEELDIRIFATDLDAGSIAFARRGIYPGSAFSDMAPELVQKYFTGVDDAYQIKKRIRALTVFGEYDLGQRAPFPRIDLVLCRNVLIYFTKELQQRTLQLFAFSLREGGYLVLGKSETTSPLPQYFTTLHPLMKVFRRKGERLMVTAPFMGAPASDRGTSRRNVVRPVPVPRRSADMANRWSLSERLGSFLFDSEIGVLAVDRNYDIQTVNQAARQMLGIRGQGVGEDLIHLIAGTPSQEMKSALDDTFRHQRIASSEILVSDVALDEVKYLKISCYPEGGNRAESAVSGVIVLFEDVTKEVVSRRALKEESERNSVQLGHVTKRNEELLERQRSLIDANNELAVANNELRSTNEHLLISAEEAEASAEEVETLNEEMQATSEELETLNEELQATVEELNTTNEELGARGDELQRVANEREQQLRATERRSLLFEGAVEKSPLPMLVVDGKGMVVKASDLYLQVAASNDSQLPRLGDVWTSLPASLEVKRDGHVARYDVHVIAVERPEEKGTLVTLIPR